MGWRQNVKVILKGVASYTSPRSSLCKKLAALSINLNLMPHGRTSKRVCFLYPLSLLPRPRSMQTEVCSGKVKVLHTSFASQVAATESRKATALSTPVRFLYQQSTDLYSTFARVGQTDRADTYGIWTWQKTRACQATRHFVPCRSISV